MENIAKLLTNWQLHPVADHFSIALLVVAVLVDIIALLFSERLWLRYMALTLMIIGAAAAAASYGTGDLEGDRVWDLVNGKAKDVLKLHAEIGYYLMYTFAVLALWRLLIQLLGFMNSTRQIYLLLAVLAVGVLLYQGKLGGELVYTYGVGTREMAAGAVKAMAAETPVPAASAQSAAPTPIPTVFVPTAAATEAPPTATAQPSAAPASPSPEMSPEPAASPSV
ncbi:MAG: DUF2231 domain-containing protein [Candidatus Binataceae bacterium]